MSMDLPGLEIIRQQIAPELEGFLSLHIRRAEWPHPDGFPAVFCFDSPPWIRERGFDQGVIVFQDEQSATTENFLHELTSALPHSGLMRFQAIFDDDDIYRRAWQQGNGAGVLRLPPYRRKVDANFVRCLCHLIFRAHNKGFPFNRDAAFRAGELGLSAFEQYEAALADEFSYLQGHRFGEICLAEMPKEFVALYGRDTAQRRENERLQAELQEERRIRQEETAERDRIDAQIAKRIHAEQKIAELEAKSREVDYLLSVELAACERRIIAIQHRLQTLVPEYDGQWESARDELQETRARIERLQALANAEKERIAEEIEDLHAILSPDETTEDEWAELDEALGLG